MSVLLASGADNSLSAATQLIGDAQQLGSASVNSALAAVLDAGPLSALVIGVDQSALLGAGSASYFLVPRLPEFPALGLAQQPGFDDEGGTRRRITRVFVHTKRGLVEVTGGGGRPRARTEPAPAEAVVASPAVRPGKAPRVHLDEHELIALALVIAEVI